MKKLIVSSAIAFSLLSITAGAAYTPFKYDFYNGSTSAVTYIPNNLKCVETKQSGHQYFECNIVDFIKPSKPQQIVGTPASIAFYRNSKKVCEYFIEEYLEDGNYSIASVPVQKCMGSYDAPNGAFVIR